tara:strand:+ start:797 stop:1156 length:360 start_codon:yes stop_codon:yes gene_type:complete
MRVNIAYSVELEDVLENVQHIFLKSEESLRNKAEHYTRILMDKYTDENLGEVLKTIDEYKAAMAKFDLKLSEINNILIGYYQMKYQPQAQEREPEVTTPIPEPTIEEDSAEEVEVDFNE